MGNIQRPEYNASGDRNQWAIDENRGWMGRIPDDRRLADISIPGTHNSCAEHGGDFVQCQSKSIMHQLELGIRFFDIRCNNFTEGEHMSTGFGIFHGQFYQHMSFGNVLSSIDQFFQTQPREAVLMRIRTAEHPDMPTPDNLAQTIFNIYRGQYPHLFYDGNINAGGGITLGQVRRRVVVLQHIQLGNFTGWNECHVEDQFEETGEVKEASIRQGFDHFASTAHNHLTITFSSTTGGIPPQPYLHARGGLNRFVFDTVEAFKRQGRGVGIVAIDFPGDELIRDIINLNFIAYIVNPSSNCVLDCQNNIYDNGTPVILWPRNGGVNQKWLISSPGYVLNVHSDRVLDGSGGGALENGTDIILWGWHGGPNQIFRPGSDRCLRNPASNKVIDCRGGIGVGTILWQQMAEQDGQTQKWVFDWTFR